MCGFFIWVFVVRGFEIWATRREEQEKALQSGEKSVDEESQGAGVVVADVPYSEKEKMGGVEGEGGDGTSVEVKEARG